MEHVDLDLDPRNPGQLKIDKLQAGRWPDVVESRRGDKLREQNPDLARSGPLRMTSVFARCALMHRVSGERKLAINLDYSVGAGKLSGSFRVK